MGRPVFRFYMTKTIPYRLLGIDDEPEGAVKD